MTAATQLTDVVTHHGEGIGWHPGEGVVKLVDLLAGNLLTLRSDRGVDRLHVGDVAAAWRPRTGGGVVVGTERGFATYDASGVRAWETEVWVDPALRMNDGACDRQGRFYCGSMAYDARPGAGAMWRLDPDRSVHLVREGLTISNGLVWSLDASEAFHVDTPTGRIDGFRVDPDTGQFVDRRTVVHVAGGDPDGMTIDAEGGLWVALWGGSAVHRYEQSGALSAVVEVPARQVTSCGFGGDELDRLYITTSREGLTAGDDPAAGAVFVADVGVRGVPLNTYSG